MDYKSTLNLPRTDFPMKADLAGQEPEWLKKWEAARLYESIQAQRVGAEKFILHDGPPFANGDVHIGNALNKILKDIIVKYKTLRGFSAPYVPGWDCHGLPIEFKVTQDMLTSSARSLSASVSLAIGIILTSPSERNTKPMSCACSRTSWSKDLFIGARNRFIGASPAEPPWPKRKSNTRTTSVKAFM